MAKRKSLTKKIRFEVFKRDGFVCQYCGERPPSVVLEVDHLTPVSKGGTNHIDNLATSCFDCNRGKGATELTSVPQSVAERAKLARESEDQLAAMSEIVMEKTQRLKNETWHVIEIYNSELTEIDKNDFNSIANFIEVLGFDTVCSAMRQAASNDRIRGNGHFKYFCGICWTKIREGKNG